jgi:hypothetical protein
VLRLFPFLLLALSSFGADGVTAGAIRWDAWSGGPITREVERTLSPEAHRRRLPWFAQLDDKGAVRLNGAAEGVMEQEIAYARRAGLDYWAFLTYPEESEMSGALLRYLGSPKRGEIGFCLILHQSLGVPEGRWPRELSRLTGLIGEKGYQKIGGRPLLFVFESDDLGAPAAARLEQLRQKVAERGHAPYVVHMGWNPANDFTERRGRGFDAVSAYAEPSAEPDYGRYVAKLEARAWQGAKKAGAPYVPLVSTGWDKRPRQDHPVSWEKNPEYATQKTFPAAPTPEELAAHLSRALDFVRNNPETCPARTVIIYAWNEHDEGGWLCPTWTSSGRPDTSRIEAVAKALGR